jgi:hypothetical protein
MMYSFVFMQTFIAFFYLYVSNNYRYLFSLAIILASLSLIGTIIIFESPIWLLKEGRVSDAKLALKKIMSANDF